MSLVHNLTLAKSALSTKAPIKMLGIDHGPGDDRIQTEQIAKLNAAMKVEGHR